MRRVLGVLLAGALITGVLAGTALAYTDVDAYGTVAGCVEADHGTATITVTMENLTGDEVHMWVEFANRSTAASPPFWRWPPWYSMQEVVLAPYETASASWTVGPDTHEYRYWLVRAWVNAPYNGANIRFVDGYMLVPECTTRAEQLIGSGVPGKGLATAPGLQKEFTGNAVEKAG